MPFNQQAKAGSKMPQARASRITSFALALALAAAAPACAPVVNNRGYIFDDRLIETLQKGLSSVDTVRTTFGSPTTRTTLNGQSFYYVYSRFVTESYRAPEEVERKVLAIHFNKSNRLDDYALYSLKDGIIIPIIARTTQTQGRELTVLEQLFGNLGRLGDEAPGSEF
jgi:outer membrane protein assembly factor BamE (lipoprotein component of BamABCDE complex)